MINCFLTQFFRYNQLGNLMFGGFTTFIFYEDTIEQEKGQVKISSTSFIMNELNLSLSYLFIMITNSTN